MPRLTNKPLIFLAVIASLATLGLIGTHGLAQTKYVPTYYVDIKPILEKNCTSCHTTGGIAPFALDNPTDAVKWADRIAQVTKSGYMPPWPPSKDGEPFLYERRLGAASKQLLEDWAKAKAPLGKAPRQ
jgi:mono/diheme cytochrome c family protein